MKRVCLQSVQLEYAFNCSHFILFYYNQVSAYYVWLDFLLYCFPSKLLPHSQNGKCVSP